MFLQALSSVRVEDAPDPHIIHWGEGEANTEPIPKIIWIFWESEKPSPTVDLCINRAKIVLKDFTINILNFKNLKEYLPDFEYAHINRPMANIADLIRLELIYSYGGIWMDASIFLAEGLDWIYQLKEGSKCDFVGFYTERYSSSFKFPMVENWFFGAPKNCMFIKDWLNEFKKCLFSIKPSEYYKNIEKDIYRNLPNPEYLLPYISVSLIIRNSSDYKLALYKSEDIGHLYNVKYLFTTPSRLQNVLLLSKSADKLPMLIKLTNSGRQACDMYINKGIYKFNSIFYKLSTENTGNKYFLRLKRLFQFILNFVYNKIPFKHTHIF